MGWYAQRLADAPQRNEANVLSTFPECPLTGTHVSGSFGSKHLRLLMPKSLLWSRAPTPAACPKADPLADVQILGPHLSEEVSLTLIIHRGAWPTD